MVGSDGEWNKKRFIMTLLIWRLKLTIQSAIKQLSINLLYAK